MMEMVVKRIATSSAVLISIWLLWFLILWLGGLFYGVPLRISFLALFGHHLFAVPPALAFASYSVRILSNSFAFAYKFVFISHLSLIFIFSSIYGFLINNGELNSPIFGVFSLDFGIMYSMFYLVILLVLVLATRRT